MKASTTRTGLSSPTKSSKHSGSSMSWARSCPSTKRFTLVPSDIPPQNTRSSVFTQPRPIADTRRSPAAASYGVIPGTLHSCQTTSARSFGERCYERRLAAEDGSGIHYGTDQRASTRRELIRFRIWGRAGQRRLDRVAVVGVQLWCNLDGELSGPPPDRSLLITGQDGPERIL